jgi:hypothetical protein
MFAFTVAFIVIAMIGGSALGYIVWYVLKYFREGGAG